MSPKSKGRRRPPARRPQVAGSARQAALRAARRRSARRRWTVAAVFLVVVLVLGLSQVTGGDDQAETDSGPTTTVALEATPVSLPTPPPGASITGATPCPEPDGSSPRTTSFAEPPPLCIDPDADYAAEMLTSKGLVTVDLYEDESPQTVNNFVVLSRYHFYDGIPFHRIATGTFVQGGDPAADGSGGPGYEIDDELPEEGDYEVGTMAMANAGPDTTGSQFFFIVGEGGLYLNQTPNYPILGKVVGGMEVLQAIEAAGSPETADDPDGGRPTEVITIESVTIKES